MIKFLMLLLAFSAQAFAITTTSTGEKIVAGKKDSASDVSLEVNKTGNKPKINYNKSSGKWEFSNDGTTFQEVPTSSAAGTPISGGINLLEAGDDTGFESCSGASCPSWTASGGTVATESSNPLFGSKSATWDASALNQTFTSALKLIPIGLRNHGCLAMLSYKYGGSDGDYKFQVTDGTSLISGAETSLIAASDAGLAYVYFTCPTSGSLNLRLIAAVSNPGIITVDGAEQAGGLAFLGSGSVRQTAEPVGFWGQVMYPGGPAATCLFTQTTPNGSYSGFPAEATCPTATVYGRAQAPATKIPAMLMPNARAGRYRFTVAMATNVGSSSSFFRLSDGTTVSESSGMISSSTYGNPVLVLYMFFPTDGTRTVELQAGTYTGTALVNVDARYPDLEQFTMTAEYVGPL